MGIKLLGYYCDFYCDILYNYDECMLNYNAAMIVIM